MLGLRFVRLGKGLVLAAMVQVGGLKERNTICCTEYYHVFVEFVCHFCWVSMKIYHKF